MNEPLDRINRAIESLDKLLKSPSGQGFEVELSCTISDLEHLGRLYRKGLVDGRQIHESLTLATKLIWIIDEKATRDVADIKPSNAWVSVDFNPHDPHYFTLSCDVGRGKVVKLFTVKYAPGLDQTIVVEKASLLKALE